MFRFLSKPRSVPANQSPSFRRANLALEMLEDRMMLSTVNVIASGTTGQEILTLTIGGQAIESVLVSTETQLYSFETQGAVSASDVRIDFQNDFYDSATGADRNLIVERIQIDGQTFETNSESVFSTGTFNGSSQISGFGLGDTLYGNGRFSYGNESQAGSELVVFAAGETGEERLNVLIDGEFYSAFTVGTESSAHYVKLDKTVTPGSVKIEFNNDLYQPENNIDRNLTVDRIQLDGQTFETESPAVLSYGVWQEDLGGTRYRFAQSETLHTNGFFEYSNLTADTTPPTVTLGGLTVDNQLGGDVQIVIYVADETQPNYPDNNAVSVIGPDGESTLVSQTYGGINPDGSYFAGYFFRGSNGSGLTTDDNGQYQVVLNPNTAADQAGNYAPGQTLGTFTINIDQSDFIPPVASLSVDSPVTNVSANNPLAFTVVYEDDIQMGVILVDNAVTLTNANGDEIELEFAGGGGLGITIRSLSYFATPANGSWSSADNGVYTVTQNFETVFDLAGNPVAAGVIGTFEVQLS